MFKKDVKSPLLKKQNSIGLACTGIYTTALTVVSTMVVSYAASNDLGSKLKTAMQSFYNNMKDAFDTAAIAALAVALFFLLFGRSDKSAEKSYSWIFKIVGAFVVFHSLFWLVPWVASIIGGSKTDTTVLGGAVSAIRFNTNLFNLIT